MTGDRSPQGADGGACNITCTYIVHGLVVVGLLGRRGKDQVLWCLDGYMVRDLAGTGAYYVVGNTMVDFM